MSTLNEKLKDIVERNYDACKGYENACENVESNELSNVFQQQSAQRKQFAQDLQNSIGDTEVTSSAEGAVHRGWMDIKSAISSNTDKAVVEECLRGEREALETYNDLTLDFPSNDGSYQLISQQRETVQNCISQLEQYETQLS